jgi:monoamine oxidase
MNKNYDVIIVGAGYAGLTAARELIKAGKSIKVLEARDRVGGRVYTQQFEGYYLDMGGTWVGPSQDRIYNLLKELNLETFKTYDTGKSTLLFNSKLKHFKGIIPPLPIIALLSLNAAIKKINKLSKNIDLSAPWLSNVAQKWDAQTLATWMESQMGSKIARNFFKIAVEAIWAADPSEISMLHALFYTKSGRDFDTLINVKNGAQEERILGGAQKGALEMAKLFPEKTISLNSPVIQITQNENDVFVKTKTEIFIAKKVIVAIPPTLCNKISFEPQLSANRNQLTQRMPMGTVWKCYAVYEKPFWRENGLNGLATSDTGFIRVTFDNSPKDGGKGILMGFVLANKAKEFSTLNQQERREAVLLQFTNFFGEKANSPEFYIDKSYAEEEYSGGCYAGFMPTGVWTSLGESLKNPCGNIHWAGTETSEIWNGYIDGAVRSGERVAKEILEII